ncbi:GNAT family N-acetyltransferase [Sandaracinobacteroides saxicola]|uniref:GNAT family N-acetyltransferase n=1 Tax=Sandaracinobacteroides saxicola TaxID=2759707 RepID=A0A7G5IFM3_9SPHN|nr:GNAT family N-acetyltransferase [Sandaracinobacteroides saxicola]QMW22165.1 GNAT family N-acetyltransferase [Sandaracinobacteroides saxicola]
MTPAIRQLGRGDAGALRALNVMFGAAFEVAEDYARSAPGEAWLERLLARDSFVALVAEAEGTVVGGLVAYELLKAEAETSEFYIYDLAVAADWRRRGVARALLRAMGEIAAARGASAVFVQADPVDVPAVTLYEGFGPREEVFHFDVWRREA